jgi:uncharacterized protein involved in outer membrane biogenesis
MKKWILRGLLILVVLIIAGLLAVYFSLNHIVKTSVETHATDSLNLKTELNSANLSLFGGKLDLNELKIASPPGFSAPQMLTLGDTDVAVKYSQLRQDPIHISSLTLKKPTLVIEQSGGTLNFKKAMDLMPKTPEKPDSKPMKLIIDELNVQDAQVIIRPGKDLPMVGSIANLPQEITVPVPSMTMKNVGSGEGSQDGAAIKDVAMQVITALAASASNSNAVPEQLKALLHLNVADVASKLGAEAQKRITAVLPPEVGKTLTNVMQNPEQLKQDPAKALENLLPGAIKDKVKGTDKTKQQ